MEIKKVGEKSLIISNKEINILAFADKLNDKDFSKYKSDIILGKEVEGSFSINSPGEYESNEVWIMSIPSNIKDDNDDVYAINIDEVRIAMFANTVKSLTKKQIEKIGIIDILVLDIDVEDIKPLADLVGEVDPQVILITSDKQDQIDSLVKKLGLKSVREEKSKFKAKMEDFNGEDYQMELIKL